MRGFDRGFGPEAWVGRGLWFVGTILAALLIAALVAGIIWFFQRRRGTAGHGVVGSTEDPLRLAASRYAAGQIDRTQFEQIRNDLLETVSETTDSSTATGDTR